MTAAGQAQRAVVIGAGISGLATAALLARSGYEVTVLEKQEEVGGRAGTWDSKGFRFDTGPSWYLMPEVFDHFYRLLGTSASEQLDLVRLDPAYRVIFEGQREPVDIPAGRRNVVELFESLEAGAGQRLEAYLDSAEETYTMAIRQFLYTTFESFRPLLRTGLLRQLPRLVRLLLQPLDSFAGRYVSDPRLRQILGYPAVFLGASPFTAPSMFHLMSYLDLDDGVRYPQGGMRTVIGSIADLARTEGATLVTGACATAILTAPARPSDGGRPGNRRGGRPGAGRQARVTGVAYTDAAGTPQELPADVVVGAADLHHLETRLLAPELQTYPEAYWKRRGPGPGAILLCLGVQGKLPELQHHTLLFTRDWRDNFARIFGKHPSVPAPASLYVCKTSQTDGSAGPAGTENLFVLVPVPADPGLGRGGTDGDGDAQIERIADAVIEQIASWAGIGDLAGRVLTRRTIAPGDFHSELNAWHGGALGPGHVLKQSAFFRSGNASRKVSGLVYAGSSTIPGIGLPMCLISAELALKRLTGDTTTTPLPEPWARTAAAARKPGAR